MKKQTLPKHRQLLIQSMELLFSGKKSESKKVLKKLKQKLINFIQNNG